MRIEGALIKDMDKEAIRPFVSMWKIEKDIPKIDAEIRNNVAMFQNTTGSGKDLVANNIKTLLRQREAMLKNVETKILANAGKPYAMQYMNRVEALRKAPEIPAEVGKVVASSRIPKILKNKYLWGGAALAGMGLGTYKLLKPKEPTQEELLQTQL